MIIVFLFAHLIFDVIVDVYKKNRLAKLRRTIIEVLKVDETLFST